MRPPLIPFTHCLFVFFILELHNGLVVLGGFVAGFIGHVARGRRELRCGNAGSVGVSLERVLYIDRGEGCTCCRAVAVCYLVVAREHRIVEVKCRYPFSSVCGP